MSDRRVQVALIAVLLLVSPFSATQNQLEQVLNRGILNVAGRLGSLNYFERDGIANGFDYNLLTALAEYLGVELNVVLFEDLNEQLASVYSNTIDLAAATLTVTPSRTRVYEFSDPYLEVSTLLIQNSSKTRKNSLDDLVEPYSLEIIAGSSHAELLVGLRENYPELHWRESADAIMFDLLGKVQSEEIDYAVVDSSIFELERYMFPNIEVGLELSARQPVGFALPKDRDDSLLEAVNSFLTEYRTRGELEKLKQAYFTDEGLMTVAGSLVFKKRLENRLPKFEALFREVAQKYDYDWLLLAAQAYQESHWEPDARSPTGVRGLMMLTLPTARQLGVDNRLDAEQSLEGGVRYMQSLYQRIPERIAEPHRRKFALAAYNVGFGHLNDARILTQRAGADADTWEDVAKYLPLLGHKKYYSTVKHGFARGNEPVHYVNNIYRLKSILDWYTWQRELDLGNMFLEPRYEQPATPGQTILDASLSPL